MAIPGGTQLWRPQDRRVADARHGADNVLTAESVTRTADLPAPCRLSRHGARMHLMQALLQPTRPFMHKPIQMTHAAGFMTAGAIGAISADRYEPDKYRAGMNLQFGMVAAQPNDAFLMASDGLWDTLDPVQVRHSTAPSSTLTLTPTQLLPLLLFWMQSHQLAKRLSLCASYSTI